MKKSAIVFLGGALGYLMIMALAVLRYADQNAPQKADIIVVLGTAVQGDQPSAFFRERIEQGIALYRLGYAPKMMFTGGKVRGNAFSEAGVARAYAIQQGVSPTDLLLEEHSRFTLENFKYAKTLMDQEGLHTALVVSHPLHMKRAMAMAEGVGIKAYGAPVQGSRYSAWWGNLLFAFREAFFLALYRLGLQ